MKTVQHYMQVLDTDKLADYYIDTYPLSIKDYKDDDRPASEIYKKQKQVVVDFIEKMKAIELTPPEEEHVLLAYKTLDSFNHNNVSFSLILLKDINNNDVTSYAYEFSPQSEIMAYLVSNSEYTQDNIYELIVDVMNEASFFGFDQEELQDTRDKLDEAMKEVEAIKNGEIKGISFEKVMDDLGYKRFEQSEETEELRSKAIAAECEYNKHSFLEEVRKIV